MLTEEEAKTKWCPFTRVGNEAGCNRNGDSWFDAKPNCIGSACMAWRHVSEGVIVRNKQTGEQRAVRSGEFYSTHSDTVLGPMPSKRGFCGLAGAPQ